MNNRNVRRGLVRRGKVRQGLLYQRVPGGRVIYDVPMDGPDSVYVPANAQDWIDIPGFVAPTYQWNCDESSGNLTSDIGSKTLTAANAGHLYQQTVTGWGTKAVGFADNDTGSWWTSDAAFDVAEGESFCWLFYASIETTANGRILLYHGAGPVLDTPATDGLLTVRAPGASTNTVADHMDLATVRPYLYGRNCTTDFFGLYTDLEAVSVTHTDAAITGDYGIGGLGGNSLALRMMRLAFWKGTDAETMFAKATLSKLGWSLGY